MTNNSTFLSQILFILFIGWASPGSSQPDLKTNVRVMDSLTPIRLAAKMGKTDLASLQQSHTNQWVLIGTYGLFIVVGFVALMKAEAHRKLLAQNLRLKEVSEQEKRLLEETIARKERELATLAMASHEKNSILKDLEQQVNFIECQISNEMKASLKELRKTITGSYSLDTSWDSFIHKFEDVHPLFFDRLKKENPTLSMEDLKLSAYVKIGMSNKEIANVTHLTHGSVKSKINRLKKKLKLGPEESLRDYILKYGDIAIGLT